MDGIVMLTKEQALDCLVIKDGQVHNFLMSPFALLGADVSVKTAQEILEKADRIEIGGAQCRAMNHGLAVMCEGRTYFFEADNDKLDKLEPKSE